MFFQWIKRGQVYGPSWMIIGISFVLMAVVIFMGVTNYHRGKTSIEHLLQEKGDVLIRSFEAGTRTGMMGMMGDKAHLQKLLEETAARSDVSFIALVDENGMILAHSDAKIIGTIAKDFVQGDTFTPTDKSQWRTRPGEHEGTLFEVYRNFLPAAQHSDHMGSMDEHHDLSCAPGWIRGLSQERILDPNRRPAIIIGMDSTPYETILTKDIWNILVTASVVLLLAITGVVSLFWAQNYINSRKMLKDIRTFASEIVKNIPVGMIVISGDGKIMFMNELACSLFAISREDSKNALAINILPEPLLRLRENRGNGSAVVEKECTLLRTDGTTAPVNISSTNIVGEGGHYIGFMFILQDLTELRRLELTVRQREKLAAIGNLAAGIAHEIRNPLSSIKGYVTYFGSLFEEGSENRKAAGIMVGEVDRVNRVISELLEFARPSDLKVKKADILQLIDHSLRIVSHEAEFARVKIIKAFQSNLPELIIDPDRITQVLLNLLINAIQAMPEGGALTLTAEQDQDMLLLHITDTGQGVAPENLTDIFNPYFTTKKNGTGLGLAIVHKIVEDHGGTVRIRSKLEMGTTVTLALPLPMTKEFRP